MIKNNKETYGLIAKIFHWSMAVIILALLPVGFLLDDLKLPILYKLHKTFGFLVLSLVIVRILWKIINISPNDNSLPKWMKFLARLTHFLLYTLMILVPLTAFIAANKAHYPVSFLFMFDLPILFDQKDLVGAGRLMDLHGILAISLLIIIILHFIATLYHHFILKDKILQKMS